MTEYYTGNAPDRIFRVTESMASGQPKRTFQAWDTRHDVGLTPPISGDFVTADPASDTFVLGTATTYAQPHTVAGYSWRTGQQLWTSSQKWTCSYSDACQFAGAHIVTYSGDGSGVIAMEPTSGRTVWHASGRRFVVGGGRVYTDGVVEGTPFWWAYDLATGAQLRTIRLPLPTTLGMYATPTRVFASDGTKLWVLVA